MIQLTFAMRTLLLIFLLWLAAVPPRAAAESAPIFGFLKAGDTVVFLGDHITRNGDFIPILMTYLDVHYPAGHGLKVVISAREDETISGLSEPSLEQPRRVLFDRFENDVAKLKPALVVACYGMHDGIYAPPDEKRLTAFQQGFVKLTKLVTEDLDARLLVLTPPLWMGERGNPAKDLRAEAEFTERHAYAGYNDTLKEFARWQLAQKHPKLTVLDLHERMELHLADRRRLEPKFNLRYVDNTPNYTGHLLIAATLIQGLGGSPLVADLRLDAGKLDGPPPEVTDLRAEGGGLAFTWKSPIPLPIAEEWDRKSFSQEQLDTRLNLYLLTVSGLKAGLYSMTSDGAEVGTFSAQDLAKGVDLAYLPKFKPNIHAREIYRLHRHVSPNSRDDGRKGVLSPNQAQAALDKIQELRQPVTLKIQLAPVAGK